MDPLGSKDSGEDNTNLPLSKGGARALREEVGGRKTSQGLFLCEKTCVSLLKGVEDKTEGIGTLNNSEKLPELLRVLSGTKPSREELKVLKND